jgi:shikimate dehydrogenase
MWVAARRPEQGARTAELARRAARGAVGAAIEWKRPALRAAVAQADALVNATSIGMHPHHAAPAPVPASWLREGMLIYDMVYNPSDTRLLVAARRRGCRTLGGLRMLVLQGAESFTVWTGRQAPTDIMQEAVAGALAK